MISNVVVVTGPLMKDWFEASTRLFRLRRDIDLSIESVLIDSSLDRSSFSKEIRKTGEIIHCSEIS